MNIQNGDTVRACNTYQEDCRNCSTEYFYVGKSRGGDHVVQGKVGPAKTVMYVELIPEPRFIPWTNSTRPMVPFTVVNNESGREYTITHVGVGSRGEDIMIAPTHTGVAEAGYDTLLAHFLYAPTQERDNLVPCGVES